MGLQLNPLTERLAVLLIVSTATCVWAQEPPPQPSSPQPAPEENLGPGPAPSSKPPQPQMEAPGASQGQAPGPAVELGRSKTAIATSNVHLRAGPGTTYEVVTTIPAGSRMRAARCSEGWCFVTWRGQNGYIVAT